MQPDTGKRITSDCLLAALGPFSISAPNPITPSHGGGRPNLNSLMAETAPLSRSHSLRVLLAVTLLAAMISCGPAPSEEGSRNGTSEKWDTGTV